MLDVWRRSTRGPSRRVHGASALGTFAAHSGISLARRSAMNFVARREALIGATGDSAVLRIWAPNAARVEVLAGGARMPAVREAGGWWRGPVLGAGDDYSISLDGGAPRPDPRSRFQPHGVHGPSRWLAPRASPSELQPRALRDAVIYELHVGTFSEGGTFESAIQHLDHLASLGVSHVELMPIAQFAGTHGWGYDGVALYAPHAPYGGPDGLMALIDACHARGLAVLIDVVHNHFGPEGAYAPEFGPYRTGAHKTPWGDAINLDGEESAEARRFLIESALQWLRDYGADGLRLDAVHALCDTSPVHFIAELVDSVRALERQLGRPLVLIGEYDDHDPRAVTDRAAGGWGLDAHWNDDFHHAVHVLVTGESSGYYADFTDPGTLAKVLQHGYALDGRYSYHRRSRHGRPYGALPRDRLVAYVQSHDQVGNRASGERLHHLAGIERAKVAAALLMTSPFVPMLFQGEEWAASSPFCYFAQFTSSELCDAVRTGRRAEHAAAGWTERFDPIDPATRDACVLRWDELHEPVHASMLAWYRALIDIRRANLSLSDPDPESTRVLRNGRIWRIQRGDLLLVCNLADERARVDLCGEVLLCSEDLADSRALPPSSCALLRR
jgi:maltooligosyltrehalose trehalohydrolase